MNEQGGGGEKVRELARKQAHLSEDESSCVFIESSRLLEDGEEVTVLHELHDDVEVALSLEGVGELHDEWMSAFLQNTLLQLCCFDDL